MNKEEVKSLLEGLLEEGSYIQDNTNITFYIGQKCVFITEFEEDVELHFLDESTQVNKPDSTYLISYKSIDLIEVK